MYGTGVGGGAASVYVLVAVPISVELVTVNPVCSAIELAPLGIDGPVNLSTS